MKMNVKEKVLRQWTWLVSLAMRPTPRVFTRRSSLRTVTYALSVALLFVFLVSDHSMYTGGDTAELTDEEESEYYDIVTENGATFHNRTDEAISKEFRRRNKIFKKLCKTAISNKTTSLNINSKEFLINDKFKLTWCNIFKSASTNWFHLFLKLAGFDPTKQKTSLVQAAREKAYPRPSPEKLGMVLTNSSYTSIVVLREPFERILSSYKHVAGSKDTPYYHNVRCQMARKHRSIRGNCNPTFPQYVDFIIAESRSGRCMDEHWHPYTSFCSLCQVNYTYIIKFEHMEEEHRFLARKIPVLAEMEKLHRNPSHRNYSDYVPRFYGQLTRPQLDGLINIYREDFLLSGHSWLKYYHYVKRV